MKTREEMRFEAASPIMLMMLSSEDTMRAVVSARVAQGFDGTVSEAVAIAAVEYADALLAELGRTAPKPETPSPDADGWIEHRPGPRPEKFSAVKFEDGITRYGEDAEDYHHPTYRDWWDHSTNAKGCKIVAYMP